MFDVHQHFVGCSPRRGHLCTPAKVRLPADRELRPPRGLRTFPTGRWHPSPPLPAQLACVPRLCEPLIKVLVGSERRNHQSRLLQKRPTMAGLNSDSRQVLGNVG